ncbi:hypothetical protein Taro_052714 [Colocasia esculenta]|uniref:Uncharacterized protein n=1 Tax=Colocasia esculenta TaxID=4460 RepID=A0A843XKJ3_COLES|nr:hypothetical protein [Colocasia esculenta]
MTRVCLSPRTLPLRRTRMGVPGKRVRDSSALAACSTPSTGARGRGSQATVTTSLTGQALKCRAPGERLV